MRMYMHHQAMSPKQSPPAQPAGLVEGNGKTEALVENAESDHMKQKGHDIDDDPRNSYTSKIVSKCLPQ